MLRHQLYLFVFALLVPGASLRQAAPIITSAYAGEINVDGNADVGSGPIVILDTSYPAETRLGESTVSREGTFAVAVNPALIADRVLVAVDRDGRRSATFTVRPKRSGLSPAPNQ